MDDMISRQEVMAIIDEVMNNREIDSIRNAILAIRDKVKDIPQDWTLEYTARLKLRGNNELCLTGDYFDGAKYVVIDTCEKIDTGIYGAIRYE